MSEEIKLPFQITAEEAKQQNIPSIIIQPPTKEEIEKLLEMNKIAITHAESLLTSPTRFIEIEYSQNSEIVYTNEINFLADNWDMLPEDERMKRFRAAYVNLVEALTRQGKLHQAKFVAEQGLIYGAYTELHLARVLSLLEAINNDDEEWCDCKDTEITYEPSVRIGQVFGVGQVFGGDPNKKKEVVDTIPALQVVDKIPSYRHDGQIVSIVRCNNCGRMNAVPPESLPQRVFNPEG